MNREDYRCDWKKLPMIDDFKISFSFKPSRLQSLKSLDDYFWAAVLGIALFDFGFSHRDLEERE